MTFVKPFRNVSAGGFSEVVADNKFKFYIKIVCRKHEVGYGDLSILGQRIKKFRGSSRFSSATLSVSPRLEAKNT